MTIQRFNVDWKLDKDTADALVEAAQIPRGRKRLAAYHRIQIAQLQKQIDQLNAEIAEIEAEEERLQRNENLSEL